MLTLLPERIRARLDALDLNENRAAELATGGKSRDLIRKILEGKQRGTNYTWTLAIVSAREKEGAMSERENSGAGGLILLLVIAALAIGIATAIHNSNTPLAKSQRAVREAEERAQISCRRAGCPDNCYNAGMCDR